MSYARPSSAKRPARQASYGDDLYTDCKAAYLSILDELRQDINSKEQLSIILQQTGRNPTERMLRKYWTPSTKYINFDEFVRICEKELPPSEEELIKAFKRIDTNGDGYISHSELKTVMTTRGEKMSSQEVQDLIDEVDENRDGKLDYKEFSRMVMSTVTDVKALVRQKMERRETRGGGRSSSEIPAGNEDRYSQRGSRPSSARSSQGRPGSARSSSSKADADSGNAITMGAVARRARLNLPKDLTRWSCVKSKGCFHWDEEEGLLSHIYRLRLVTRTELFITCEPTRRDSDMSCPVDTALFVVSGEADQKAEERLQGFTEHRDSRGMYGVRLELQAGTYTLLPFTSGCRLRRRHSDGGQEAQLIREKNGKISLTKSFKEALECIFDVVDLDGNETLSRSEFNWYNLRTSGEELADEEWNVVEQTIDLDRGEIPLDGFLRLNEMEAEDSAANGNGPNSDDLWITLRSMGYNNALVMNEACPFMLNVYTSDRGAADLEVVSLDPTPVVSRVVGRACKDKGFELSSDRQVDLSSNAYRIYCYRNDFRITYAVENKMRQNLELRLTFDGSNIVSSSGSLEVAANIPSKATVVVISFMPKDERSEWNVNLTRLEQR